ncbi:MAG: PKD domain-containing protein [Candidatus Thermoplasmatota archaeon]|nr:PKD domain-containing protein [Candidatus Thermoplasmatota archaeon]
MIKKRNSLLVCMLLFILLAPGAASLQYGILTTVSLDHSLPPSNPPGWTEQQKLLGSYDAGTDGAYEFSGSNLDEPPVANFSWTPPEPSPNQPVLFNASTSFDPDGVIMLYEWDWESDGSYDENGTTPLATHSWTSGGAYLVTLRVIDDDNDSATHSDTVFVQSHPPTPPPINGSHYGKVNVEHVFIIGPITNPGGDVVYYLIDWGNGSFSEWLGPYDSGLPATVTHSWSEPGIYSIKVKAKDSFGVETTWSEPFILYMTSQLILIGFARSVANQTDESILLNISFAVIISLKPFDLKISSSQQILVLDDEFSGILLARFIAGMLYGLVIPKEAGSRKLLHGTCA